jgi:hypothetical protein
MSYEEEDTYLARVEGGGKIVEVAVVRLHNISVGQSE